MFSQKLGLVKAWPDNKDEGRKEVTKQEGDKFLFKVPSLRNIEKTAPYLHDGSIKDLGKLVSMMGEYQMGCQLTEAQVNSIVTFLKSVLRRSGWGENDDVRVVLSLSAGTMRER